MFVRNFELPGLLYVSKGVTGEPKASSASLVGAVSFFEVTREERAEAFLTGLCARLFFVGETFLFAFFNGDVIDLYGGSIDIARVTRRNGHQYIHALHHLTEDTMLIVKVRSRGMGNKEL